MLKYGWVWGPVGEGKGAEVRRDVGDVGDMTEERDETEESELEEL